jgi:hypothetical protein
MTPIEMGDGGDCRGIAATAPNTPSRMRPPAGAPNDVVAAHHVGLQRIIAAPASFGKLARTFHPRRPAPPP